VKLATLHKNLLRHLFLLIVGLVLASPLIYLVFGTFKSNEEFFSSTRLLPEHFNFTAYTEGWKANGQFSFTTFFGNTFLLTIPVVIATVLSCSLVAYGFARFKFRLNRPLFSLMIATMMLPNTVIMVPRYIIFNNFGWLNSYLPFYATAVCACYPFYIFLFIQFLRGLPKSLDESAHLDGYGPWRIFFYILFPLSKPALFSVGLLQLIATWNDFFNPLIYINSVRKYPLSLALRMSLDLGTDVLWANLLAMCLLSILPLVIIFFSAQQYFVEGIATTGIKG
jgi:oligogalacturonide transport system permease protein